MNRLGKGKKWCTAIVLAAGRGTRMGAREAKQYLELAGKPVLVYALEAFQASPLIDNIILMTDLDHLEYCRTEIVDRYGITKVGTIGAGGRERYETVWMALCTVWNAEGAADRGEMQADPRDGIVFIHDGARPFITGEIIGRAYEAVLTQRACVVGMPVKDTIKLTDGDGSVLSSPDRRQVWMAQTPQVFDFPLIYEAFSRQMRGDCSGITDDAMVVENQMGVSVRMVKGSYENIKITTPEDLAVAEAFCAGNVHKIRGNSGFEKK